MAVIEHGIERSQPITRAFVLAHVSSWQSMHSFWQNGFLMRQSVRSVRAGGCHGRVLAGGRRIVKSVLARPPGHERDSIQPPAPRNPSAHDAKRI